MSRTRRLLFDLLVILLVTLSGCDSDRQKQAAVTPSSAPTAEIIPSPVASSTPTPTTAPTEIPAPTSTPTAPPATSTPSPTTTPSPTATPSPTPRIAIMEFTAQPDAIAPGETITLTWSVDAEWANIRILDERGGLVEPSLTSELQGTLPVHPDPSLWSQVQFTLYAGIGDRFERSDLAVPVRCVETWAFGGPPPGCPTPARLTTIVAQQYENGLMLWLEPTEEYGPAGDIIILYADAGGTVAWEVVPDGFEESMPESDPAIVPPGDLIQPVRGFGKVWRELPGIRERLGWALEHEYVMGGGALQCSQGKYATCYVNGPHDDVYVLHPWGASWELWLGSVTTP